MIAGLFIVGGGLYHTGAAHALGRLLSRISSQNEASLLVVTMVAAALLSGLMSSAGATAVLIPVVVNVAWRAKVNPSRLLMPLAFASLTGGLLTLIGTPPNLVVSNELSAHGLRPFGFFAFTPMGVLVLGLGLGFILLLGRHLLPDRGRPGVLAAYEAQENAPSLDELAEAYRLPENLFRVRVRSSSPLVGMTLAQADLRARFNANVIEVHAWPNLQTPPSKARPVTPETRLEINDVLHVQGRPQDIARMAEKVRLGILPHTPGSEPVSSQELGMVELLLPPRSDLIGRTLEEARFRDKYDVTVLAIRHMGEAIPPHEATGTRLRFGDTLLVFGRWSRIRVLQEEGRNFVVVGQPREMLEQQRTPQRAGMAALIMVAMLGLMSFDVLPPVAAVLLAAVVMVLTGCLSMEQAYGAMNWQSVVLLAGMLPLATALQQTGGVSVMAEVLTAALGGAGPLAVLAGILALTSLFSQFISNTATTVLMAPVAYQAAVALGVEPHAFLMGVAVAASTAFATPIATLSSTMVMAPGGYRFGDFVRVGLSLQVLVLAASLVALPLLFPF
jgi:di/tricarboxylate transporter